MIARRTAARAATALLCAAAFAACVITAAYAQDASPSAAMSPVPVASPPRISLQAIPSYGNAPLMVGFFVASDPGAGARIASYHFSFGDGAVSALPPFGLFHTYRQPGNYVASVTVTTSDGRSATAFKGIVARPSQAR
ncbi:MAG: PKD domain-containing protein [Candidatus Binataceae bacterium]